MMVSMPMAHRVACLRDDVVFLVYLYQVAIAVMPPLRHRYISTTAPKTYANFVVQLCRGITVTSL